jgi:beta-lactamase class A
MSILQKPYVPHSNFLAAINIVDDMRVGSRVLIVAGAVFLAVAPAGTDAQAKTRTGAVASAPAAVAATAAAHRLVLGLDGLVAHSPMTLTATIRQLVTASGGSAGVTLVELGGATPLVWGLNGGAVFTAASTYKLAALMMEAQGVAAGMIDANGLVCYQDSDYEDGWFDDYSDGACFTRLELAQRAGLDSDNTAGHMLVRDLGGGDVLNAWAAAAGATDSVFFTDNTTTSNDLAALWTAEAKGSLGGSVAQGWLYRLLTGTATEAGIPSGVAGRSTVVHKTGEIDLVENDAALVASGPNGAYILTVMTDNLGGDAGWQLISSISSAVWSFEAARAS